MNPPIDLQHRYAGKPLLRLLDAYVLWIIGALPTEQEASLVEMTPNLQRAWNRKEEQWYEVLEAEMQFPPTMAADIREIWQKNQGIAAANSVTLTPLHFTYMFVDQNFGHDT